MLSQTQLNVLGQPLKCCCTSPMTGFYRDGHCRTGPEDKGSHLICVRVTNDFLLFSKSKGNDLITPMPIYQFKGLKEGDKWCLCALRWKEAFDNNCAPKAVLECTNIGALEFVSMKDLKEHSSQLKNN